jgi:hypothetical protein
MYSSSKHYQKINVEPTYEAVNVSATQEILEVTLICVAPCIFVIITFILEVTLQYSQKSLFQNSAVQFTRPHHISKFLFNIILSLMSTSDK